MFKQIAVAFLAASVSTLAHSAVTSPVCIQTGPNTYRLSYSLTNGSHEVSISASSDPSGNRGRVPVLRTSSTQVTVTAGRPGQRMYFFLKPDHGHVREVSIRHIALQGTPNFRDIGGYETTDGRFVKWGLVYRTGVLTYLTPSDLAYLRQLGVRLVVDFRTDQENQEAPEKWVPNSGAVLLHLPIGAESGKSLSASMRQLAAGHPTPAQLQQRLEQTYSSFVFQFAPKYARVFTEIEQDHLPIVYHCTAGKDRTGVMTALLLRTLGVPEPTVLADYALTNKYLMSANDHSVATQKLASLTNGMMKDFTPAQRKVLMAADPAYLKATFRAIDQKYGSFANYRRQALGVSDADVQKLRALLLSNE